MILCSVKVCLDCGKSAIFAAFYFNADVVKYRIIRVVDRIFSFVKVSRCLVYKTEKNGKAKYRDSYKNGDHLNLKFR